LRKRFPSVGSVLLPEGGVGLVAAGQPGGLLDDGSAVSKRSRRASGDPLRVRVQADAELRAPAASRSPESGEEAHKRGLPSPEEGEWGGGPGGGKPYLA